MLAHGTGIDELALLLAAVIVFLVVSGLARRRRANADAPAADRCPYCDASLEPTAVRCRACGFRAPRAIVHG